MKPKDWEIVGDFCSCQMRLRRKSITVKCLKCASHVPQTFRSISGFFSWLDKHFDEFHPPLKPLKKGDLSDKTREQLK